MNSCFVNRQHINPLSTFAGATVSEPSTIQQQSFLATVRRLSPLTKVRNKAQQERLVKSVLLLSNYGLFQPTRPVQGVTLLNFHFSFAKLFQPTRPVRDVTVNTEEDVPYRWFQPTRPVRGVTASSIIFSHHNIVSTHTPRAGRDSNHGKLWR